MSTELVVYIYIALCCCMLLYNLFYISYVKADNKISSRRIAKWKKIMLKSKGSQVNFLNKRLRHFKELFIFDEALTSIMNTDKKRATKYLNKNGEAFLYLAKLYDKRYSMKKAYYAYMMSKYTFSDHNLEKRIAKVIVSYTIDSSIYCRENALKALYSINDIESIVEAYRLMNKNRIYHNPKLVVDGLLNFKGKKIALANALWEHKDEFIVDYQIAFIDYARMINGDFCERLYDFLLTDNVDNEIKYAILRYFRKYRYEPVREYLYNCLNFRDGISWEFVAIAASTLDNYPSEKTIKILKNALSANNWYVRYNAADSLLRLGITYLELQAVYNSNDRYAREMIEYKMQEKNIIA